MPAAQKFNTFVTDDTYIGECRRVLSAYGWPRSWGFWFGFANVLRQWDDRYEVVLVPVYQGVHQSVTSVEALRTCVRYVKHGPSNSTCIDIYSTSLAIEEPYINKIYIFEDYFDVDAFTTDNVRTKDSICEALEHRFEACVHNISNKIHPELLQDSERELINWYNIHVANKKELDPYLSYMYSNSLHMIHTFARVLASNNQQVRITVANIKHAISIFEYVLYNGMQLHCDEYLLADDKLSSAIDKIRMYLLREYYDNGTPIEHCTGTTVSRIKNCVRRLVNGDQVDIILLVMHEMGYVKIIEKAHFNGGKPTTIYLPTEQLAVTETIGDSLSKHGYLQMSI